ncbi:MAG: hypothetical protein K2W92_09435 [Alphaproteobacteria bacterium]|nr:hypothetical protein [Alphaproteobacteria bacterium]
MNFDTILTEKTKFGFRKLWMKFYVTFLDGYWANVPLLKVENGFIYL